MTRSFEGSAHAQASDTFQRLWNKYKGQVTQARYVPTHHHHDRHYNHRRRYYHRTHGRVLWMLEKWLARYPGPFVRQSPFANPGAKPEGPPLPATMRQTLGAFLERATVKAAPQFGQALARMSDRLAELTATAAATAQPCEEPGEGLDDSAPEDFSGSYEELLTEYQARDLLKVPFNNI